MENAPTEEDGRKDGPDDARVQDEKAKSKIKSTVRKTKSLGESNLERMNRFSDSKNSGVRLVWRTNSTAELESLGKVLGIARPSQRTRSPSPRTRQPPKVDEVFSEYFNPLAFQKRVSIDCETLENVGNSTDSKPNQHDLKSASTPELREKVRRDASKFKGIPMPSVKSLKDIFEKFEENMNQHKKCTPRMSETFGGHEFSGVTFEGMQHPNIGRKASLLFDKKSEPLKIFSESVEATQTSELSTMSDKEEKLLDASNTGTAAVATLPLILDNLSISQEAKTGAKEFMQTEPHTNIIKGENDRNVSRLAAENKNITNENVSSTEQDRNDDEFLKVSGTVQSLKRKWESLMLLNSATSSFPKKAMLNTPKREIPPKTKNTTKSDLVNPSKSENRDLEEHTIVKQDSAAAEADTLTEIKVLNSPKKDETTAEFALISEDAQHTNTTPKAEENEEKYVNIQQKEDSAIQKSSLHYSVKDITLLYENKKVQDINKQALSSITFNSLSRVRNTRVTNRSHTKSMEDMKRYFSLDADQETPTGQKSTMTSCDKENPIKETNTEASLHIDISKGLQPEKLQEMNISRVGETEDEAIFQNTNDTLKQIITPMKAEEREQKLPNVDADSALKAKNHKSNEENDVKIELNNSEIDVNKQAINEIATDSAVKEDLNVPNNQHPSKIELLIKEFAISEGLTNYLEVPKDGSFSPTATNILESEHPLNMSHLMQANDTFRYPDLHEHVTENKTEDDLIKSRSAQESDVSEKDLASEKVSPLENVPDSEKEAPASEKAAQEEHLPPTDIHKPLKKATVPLRLTHSMRSSSRELKEDELKFFKEIPTNKKSSQVVNNSQQVEGRERASTIELSSPSSKDISEDKSGSELRSSFRKFRKLHTDELKFFGAKQKSPKSASEVSLHKSSLLKVMRSKSIDEGGGRKE